MPSETTTSTPNWTALQGRVLDGGYEISECLLTNPASATFRIRVLGDRSALVLVNIFTAEAAPLEQYLLWQEALDLRHPNVSTPITVGRLNWDGASYPYVLLRKADENLAGVLGERALTPAETREVVRGVGAGLEYLHASGFVHAALSPEHVLAVGDTIRISSTSIRRINTPVEDGESDAGYRAPESAAENLTMPADVWCLGATLFEVLTRQKCAGDCREQVKALPDPFDWIVERCLETEPHDRPTLSEVFAMLSGGVKRPAAEPVADVAVMTAAAGASAGVYSATGPEPAGAAASAVSGAAYSSGAATAAATTVEAPPAASTISHQPAEIGRGAAQRQAPATPRSTSSSGLASPGPSGRPTESPRPKLTGAVKPVYTDNRPRVPQLVRDSPTESPRIKFLSYAFLAIVLAGGLLWLTRPKPERPHPSPSTPAARTQTVTPPNGSSTAAVASTQPESGSSATRKSPAAASSSASSTAFSPANSWRVVVFTFSRKQEAESRARNLSTRHPGFNPEVYLPDAKGPYLIVLGGPMSRDEANRLRQKARAAGFPRDAYVQNFNH